MGSIRRTTGKAAHLPQAKPKNTKPISAAKSKNVRRSALSTSNDASASKDSNKNKAPKAEAKTQVLRSQSGLKKTDFYFMIQNEVPNLIPLLEKFQNRKGHPAEVMIEMSKVAEKQKGFRAVIAKAAIFRLYENAKDIDNKIKLYQLKSYEEAEAKYMLKTLKYKDNNFISFADFYGHSGASFFDFEDKSNIAVKVAQSRAEILEKYNKKLKKLNTSAWTKASAYEKFMHKTKNTKRIKAGVKQFGAGSKIIKKTLELYKLYTHRKEYDAVKSLYIKAKTPEEKDKALKKAYGLLKKLGLKSKNFEEVKPDIARFFKSEAGK